jgi:3-phenylpropionate/trans-cinnamate dioxygenase alpha subunit
MTEEQIRSLVDARNGTVKPAIYTDAALYELELERVWPHLAVPCA